VQGEYIACRAQVQARSRVPTWAPFLEPISGPFLKCHFRLVLVDSTYGHLKSMGTPSSHAQNMKATACLPSVFPPPSSLFGLITTRFVPFLYAFLALLMAALSTVMAKRKSRPRSCSLGRNPMVIGKVLTERKTALETRISIWTRRGRIKMRGWSVKSCRDHYLTAGANVGADTPQTRWVTSETQKDWRQRGLPAPDDASARTTLHKGMDAPDPATVKDFLCFHIPTSHSEVVEKPTADSVNTSAEWFSPASPVSQAH
jgi:hypothetical protein